MQITFTGHHMDLTQPIKDFAEEKLTRLAKHLPSIMTISVTLNVEKTRQRAEATIHAPGTNMHASSESEDMYSAIDMLYDKLKSQVDKHKNKMKEH